MKKIILFSLLFVCVSVLSYGQNNVKSVNNTKSVSPINDDFKAFEKNLFAKLGLNSDQESMLNESLIWNKIQMGRIKKETPATDPSLDVKISNQRTAFENKVKGFLSSEQQQKLKTALSEVRNVKTASETGE